MPTKTELLNVLKTKPEIISITDVAVRGDPKADTEGGSIQDYQCIVYYRQSGKNEIVSQKSYFTVFDEGRPSEDSGWQKEPGSSTYKGYEELVQAYIDTIPQVETAQSLFSDVARKTAFVRLWLANETNGLLEPQDICIYKKGDAPITHKILAQPYPN